MPIINIVLLLLLLLLLSVQTEYERMYISFALIINLSWIFSITNDLFYVSPRKQLNSCVGIANFVTHNSKI